MISTCRSSSGIRRATPTITAIAFLLLRFLVILETIHSEIGKKQHVLLPRDVSYDKEARRALQQIRRKQHDSSILQQLDTCGNPNQVTMTMMGYKGGRIQDQVNQDRAFVQSPLTIQKYNHSSSRLLLGVLDGHGIGGEEVAEYALQQLPKRLTDKLEQVLVETKDEESLDAAIQESLVKTFVEIDESIPANGHAGGCTASVVLQLGSKLYIANAGDSVSVVAVHVTTTNTTRVVYTTREDKPHLPDEYNRIHAMGGSVYIPPDPTQDSSRVIYTDAETGYQSGLAMSRSIGDWDMVGVIAEPIVHVLNVRQVIANATRLNEEDTMCIAAEETCQAQDSRNVHVYLISATDGMMDYISPLQMATSFAEAFYQQGGPHPLTAAEDLILAAAKGWNMDFDGEYRDDIAIAASKVLVEEDLQDRVEDESSS